MSGTPSDETICGSALQKTRAIYFGTNNAMIQKQTCPKTSYRRRRKHTKSRIYHSMYRYSQINIGGETSHSEQKRTHELPDTVYAIPTFQVKLSYPKIG